jgi:hypothetical protein
MLLAGFMVAKRAFPLIPKFVKLYVTCADKLISRHWDAVPEPWTHIAINWVGKLAAFTETRESEFNKTTVRHDIFSGP